MSDCPCGSGAAFEACCGPIISGETPAPTAEALMRSRYSAFATCAIDHLHDSLAPGTRDDFNFDETRKWAESSTWLGLEIATVEGGGEDDKEGIVEFTASFKQEAGASTHRERGNFKKIDGQWYYVDGKVLGPTTIVKDKKIGRNEPCPCGSGKKFKKCCG
ncbi:MAG: YchJ family protein [Proteobacteria bacterium]|nr:YchJ family protein [Pseudomonadota bacterium]MBU1612592.1 YchJ family protein [Pseudomonadota bacterium]